MANLTITVDEESLKRARIRALEEGTSVNAVLRDFLESYAGAQRARRNAVSEILTLSRQARSWRGGRTWSRDELHESPPAVVLLGRAHCGGRIGWWCRSAAFRGSAARPGHRWPQNRRSLRMKMFIYSV